MIRVWRKHNERMSVRGDVPLKFVDSGLFGEHLDAKKTIKIDSRARYKSTVNLAPNSILMFLMQMFIKQPRRVQLGHPNFFGM